MRNKWLPPVDGREDKCLTSTIFHEPLLQVAGNPKMSPSGTPYELPSDMTAMLTCPLPNIECGVFERRAELS